MAPQNRIVFGTMTCGPEGTSGARITSIKGTKEILDTFKSFGYDELDTARMYCEGNTEKYLAQVGYKESGFKLATKVYPVSNEHEPEVLKAKLEESLDALGQTSTDIFYLHAPAWETPLEPTLKAVDELYRAGKFRTFAISNYCAWQIAEISILCRERGWVRPTLAQYMYNAITRSIEAEVIPACRKYGLDLVVYNPLAGGFFAGTYRKDETPAEGRFSHGKQGENYRKRYFRDSYFEALQQLRPVAEKSGISLLQMALRWLVHHSDLNLASRGRGGNDGIIIGASSVAHLESNLRDFEEGPLPDNVVAALDDAWRTVKADTPNYWHGDVKVTYQV
ncbi:putative Aflatoxin B1-aldehyde reductase [Taphrina deformans PYCC 5710]|uniref:Aflatoxin B1-aldehyde reductase n=1 Tax=Taphrina deformans (strain PYCC 5710 / ATCC 11124 / CBS 356.35 / IMI 108563 / JCM 9778 / NBRC 8474) TaxID=1097556 RepID=R4XCP2_TAPDE|nr:putative Aflatoxin B1-aldehyde reductase [Taphrina deformans PYCC 5710]|eukprot:CCG82151.1 putative Aflatoxin B1-aldehyde reductase [Taphrina deformans PYCC 5710]